MEVAGASWSLVKPAKARRPGDQINRNGETAQDHIGRGEYFVSFHLRRDVLRSAEVGVGGLVTPGVPEFPVEPPCSYMKFNRGVDVLDLIAGGAAEWYQ
jgi:hypothetical protein